MGAATILHADLDSFYASVEQRDDPRLLGRPVAVGGGVILAASYEAKAHGVTSAMGGRRAQALCPDLVVVPPRFSAYTEASRAVFEIFRDTAPLVEGISIDEAFLDVRGLEHISGTPPVIAAKLRARVREEVDLPITVGVARTKFLAKVVSAFAKPDGLLVVEPADESAFLHPLEVERLWGVGAKTAARLHECGLMTVGDVAALDEPVLVGLLGPAAGRKLHALSHNRDLRRVQRTPARRSIGAQSALGRRQRSPEELGAILAGLTDRVARRLRGADRLCRTVVLRLRFADYEKATRSRTLTRPTQDTAPLLATLTALFDEQAALIADRGLTLVGISLTNLSPREGAQLVLPFDRRSALDAAVDSVKDKFGSSAVARASTLGRRLDVEMPMLDA